MIAPGPPSASADAQTVYALITDRPTPADLAEEMSWVRGHAGSAQAACRIHASV